MLTVGDRARMQSTSRAIESQMQQHAGASARISGMGNSKNKAVLISGYHIDVLCAAYVACRMVQLKGFRQQARIVYRLYTTGQGWLWLGENA